MNLGLFSFPRRQAVSGLVYLGQRTFRNQASTTFIKELTPDIDVYRLVFNNLVMSVAATTGISINAQLSDDKGASYDPAGNFVYCFDLWHNTNHQTGGGVATSFYLTAPDPDAGYGGSGVFDIYCNNRGLYTQFTGMSFGRNADRGANVAQGNLISGAFRHTRRINAIKIVAGSGVIVSGETRLYGYVQKAD